MAGGDASEVLDLAEEPFDGATVFIESRVKPAPRCCWGRTWKNRGCPSDCLHCPRTIIAFIRENKVGFQPLKQGFNLGDVIALSTRQDQADWIAMRVCGEVDFTADPTP